jgi:hypothetical protein
MNAAAHHGVCGAVILIARRDGREVEREQPFRAKPYIDRLSASHPSGRSDPSLRASAPGRPNRPLPAGPRVSSQTGDGVETYHQDMLRLGAAELPGGGVGEGANFGALISNPQL